MRSFEPIAIVGRSCVLPGALSPEALFEAVRDGQVLIGPAPDRAWGLDAQRLLGDKPTGSEQEFVLSDHGGYVTGFDEVFDPARFADRVQAPERLDQLTQWLLHCASGALEEAGVTEPPPGTGLIIGNLSYPTVEHTRFVEDHWLGAGDNAPLPGRAGVNSDPRNRFSSGYPTHIVAQAMGLTGDVFALDAACASSLYALDAACRRLHSRESNLMLAGGIARADPLFIHLGFTALQALSPSSRSRPFHKEADGLLPAEGAGLVALKRVDDAVRDGDHIYGVIRGIGLSNDGRQSGFLAPAIQGQIQAMCAAYEQAGLTPQDVDFVECHATGTSRGDSVELDSLASVWGDGPKPVIGSLKANIGHPITASGVASLLKVLCSFEAKTLTPTPCDDPLDAVTSNGFRVLTQAEPWPSDGPRRAAVSNFGFGGNNAHMIVEEWTGSADHLPQVEAPESTEPIVIAAIGVIAGDSLGLPAFTRRLTAAVGEQSTVTDEISLDMKGLGFPPRDLQESLAQQTSILAVTAEALAQIPDLNPHRTGVYVGMCVDPEVARHGLRVRLQDLLGGRADDDGWRAANGKAARHLTAAGVLGCMPNIPANRLHTQRDWTSPGFTVASEELSGIDALKLAVMALQAGDIDAALVGASDFSHEEAHKAAARALFPEDRQRPGDAAVALVVMRQSDAIAGDFPVIARLDELEAPATNPTELSLVAADGQSEVTARFGHAHGASGLLHVAAGAITAHLDIRLDQGGAWPDPRRPGGPRTRVRVASFSGREATVDLSAPERPSHLISPVDAPLCRFYGAESREALGTAVTADTQSLEGAVRIGLIAQNQGELEQLRRHAASELQAGRAPAAPGLEFGEGELEGEVAFCYTGAAAAYPGAAKDLLMAFPQIGHQLAERFEGTPTLARDLYGADITHFSPATQLTGSSFVCQAHTTFTRDILGIQPEVSMGLSSGETNSLMAFGVWNDLDDMLVEIETSEMYANQLTGEFRAAAKHWELPEGEIPSWKCWRIAAPLEEVEQAIADEPLVYLTVIHHYSDVVIGGETEACERVLAVLGRQRAMDLGLDMVVHCAPLAPFADLWRQIHTRETHPVPDVRFYTNAGNKAYVPTREAAADAITQQALEPIDLPKTIEQAYEDGVRVFIEHGPRATVTGAIRHVLEGRPHLVVALDPHEGAGLGQVARAVARLWASGVTMDLTLFAARMAELCQGTIAQGMPEGTVLHLPVHSPDVLWPKTASKEPAMKPSPPSPPPPCSRSTGPHGAPTRHRLGLPGDLAIRRGLRVRWSEPRGGAPEPTAHGSCEGRDRSAHRSDGAVQLRSGGTRGLLE